MRRPALAALSLVSLLAAAVLADTTLTAVTLPGGTSAVWAYTMASAHGQPSSLATMESGQERLEPGLLCVEVDDLPMPAGAIRFRASSVRPQRIR